MVEVVEVVEVEPSEVQEVKAMTLYRIHKSLTSRIDKSQQRQMPIVLYFFPFIISPFSFHPRVRDFGVFR